MTDTRHYKLFSDLIKISIGNAEAFPEAPNNEEWEKLYNEANRQAISGILLEGVQRLPKEQRPPRQMLMNWFSTVQQIMAVNRQVNKDTVKISQKWGTVGYRNIILKGQANAHLYPSPLARVSGDIDIWIDAPRKEVISYIRKMFPKEEVTWIEMNFPVLKSTLVEVHFQLTYLYDPFTNRKLQNYLGRKLKHAEELKIEATADDFKAEMETIAKAYGMNVDDVEKAIGSTSEYLKESIVAKKTIEHLAEKAVKVAPKAEEAKEEA